MKIIAFLFLLLSAVSCGKNPAKTYEEEHIKLHEEMDRVSEEFQKFEIIYTNLYKESDKNPEGVIKKCDSLLYVNASEKDKYKSQIKSNISDDLNYLKAELYYKLGQYENSLKILESDEYRHGETALAIAANYTKLKKFDKAKMYVDSIQKSYYIYNYALGNYYESIGDKKSAMQIYNDIKQNKEIKHYAFYKLTINRIGELEKNNPLLLNELHYPTRNPDYEIAETDNFNRHKIYDLIQALPGCEKEGVCYYQSPQTNDKDYYWIKVGHPDFNDPGNLESWNTKYNFFVYPANFEIKYYDPEEQKTYTIQDWQKNVKK